MAKMHADQRPDHTKMIPTRQPPGSGAEGGGPAPPGNPRPAPSAQDEAYDIRIAADGTWFHEGAPIGRIALVKLFATVLRRDEAGDYWLVTPAERGRIVVEDAPFLAVAMTEQGEGADRALVFRTNLDHEVAAGPDHPLTVKVDAETGEPRPYIRVKGDSETTGLHALIARSVFYDLVSLAETDDRGRTGVWSRGHFFPLDRDTTASGP